MDPKETHENAAVSPEASQAPEMDLDRLYRILRVLKYTKELISYVLQEKYPTRRISPQESLRRGRSILFQCDKIDRKIPVRKIIEDITDFILKALSESKPPIRSETPEVKALASLPGQKELLDDLTKLYGTEEVHVADPKLFELSGQVMDLYSEAYCRTIERQLEP